MHLALHKKSIKPLKDIIDNFKEEIDIFNEFRQDEERRTYTLEELEKYVKTFGTTNPAISKSVKHHL